MDMLKFCCIFVVFILEVLPYIAAQRNVNDDYKTRQEDKNKRQKAGGWHPETSVPTERIWSRLSRQVQYQHMYNSYDGNLGESRTYPGNLEIIITVRAHEKFGIKIEILDFDLREKDASGQCTDYIEIWQGNSLEPSASDYILERQCGSTGFTFNPNYCNTVESSGSPNICQTLLNETTIHMYSVDDGLQRTGKGFLANVSRVLITKINAKARASNALARGRLTGQGPQALIGSRASPIQGSQSLLSLSVLLAFIFIVQSTRLTQGSCYLLSSSLSVALGTIFHQRSKWQSS